MKDYRLRLGKSIAFCSKNFSDQLNEAKRLHFDTVDFDIAGSWSKPEEENEYYEKTEEGMAAVAEAGIPVNGVHISFGVRWDISQPIEERRAAIVEKVRKTIKRTLPLNPYCYILHGSFEPIAEEDRALHISALIKSMKELSSVTEKFLCIETLPRTCLLNTAEEAIRILDDVAMPNVKICVDVNHFLQEKSEDAVEKLGGRICTTHISDHDYINERHWLPMQGKIDWMKLIGNLEKIGYNGVFNYETSASAQEIKENYEQLFSRYNAQRG